MSKTRDRSHSRDLNKRMGGGKKGEWNSLRPLSPTSLDSRDPNYDSENSEPSEIVFSNENNPVSKTIAVEGIMENNDEFQLQVPVEIKQKLIKILEEYFISGELEEVSQSINELDANTYHFEVVKRCITMSMDRHEKEREMASKLLSYLYETGILSDSQIAHGFRRTLILTEDLKLDHPTTIPMLSTFVARAIVDELLTPKFLQLEELEEYSPEVVEDCIHKLSKKHGTIRMEKAWGPGDGRSVDELKIVIDQFTKEFLLSQDVEEASRCVKELQTPHFHHEVIKRGLRNAMEEGNVDACKFMNSFFAYLVVQEIVSKEQITQGFEKMKDAMNDLKLDVPLAPQLFQDMIKQAKDDQILLSTFEA